MSPPQIDQLKQIRQLDDICDRFESDWQSGQSPKIEEVVEQVDPGVRQQLLELLIPIEVELLSKANQPLSEDAWLRRFPSCGSIIHECLETAARKLETSLPETEHAVLIESTKDLRLWHGQPANGVSNIDTAPIFSPGMSVGRYEIVEVIGEGGMGIVFKARDTQADRFVALKVIRRERFLAESRSRRATILQRFQLEAKAAARLQHDHLVSVFDVGEDNGVPYYTMQLVKGISVGDRLKSKTFQPNAAAKYIADAARGIHHVHRSGILHRDIKPSNLLIDSASKRVMVTDFGLAKLIDADLEATATGDVFGTPPYMSPEQVKDSGSVTVASDVYSLGATLYHMLTGRPPFDTTSPLELMRLILDEPPPRPRQIDASIPRDLETICLKCLEKSPDRRYASADELADDLVRFRRGEPVTARPVGQLERTWRWSRRNPVLAGLMLLAGALFVVAVRESFEARNQTKLTTAALGKVEKQLKETDRQRTKAQAAAELAETERKKALDHERLKSDILFTARMNLVQHAVEMGEISRAKRLLAPYQAPEQHTSRDKTDRRDFVWRYWANICRRHLHSLDGALLHTAGGGFIEPDKFVLATVGRGVGFAEMDGDALTIDSSLLPDMNSITDFELSESGTMIAAHGAALGGPGIFTWDIKTRQAARFPNANQFQLSPDGSLLATVQEPNKLIVYDSRRPKHVVPLQASEQHLVLGSFSPDGRLLTSITPSGVHVWDIAQRNERFFIPAKFGAINGVAFASKGDRLAISSSRLGEWDTATGELVWSRYDQDLSVGRGLLTRFVDNDQQILRISRRNQGTRQAYLLVEYRDAANGKVVSNIRIPCKQLPRIALSPDTRTLLVMHTHSVGLDVWDISVDDDASNSPSRIAHASLHSLPGAEHAFESRFSPDGNHVAVRYTLQPRIGNRHKHFPVIDGWASAISVWETKTRKLLSTFVTHNSGVTHEFVFDASGKHILASGPVTNNTSGTGRKMHRIDIRTGEVAALDQEFAHVFRISDGGKYCATHLYANGPEPIGATIREVASNRILWKWPKPISACSFSRDGEQLAIASGKTLSVHSTTTGDIKWESTQPVKTLTFSPDGTKLAISSAESVRVFSASTGQLQLELREACSGVSFSPGNQCIALIREQSTTIWELRTGELEMTLPYQTATSFGAFSPVDEVFISGGSGGVQVWQGIARE